MNILLLILCIVLGIPYLYGLGLTIFKYNDTVVNFDKRKKWDWVKIICLFIFVLLTTIVVIYCVLPMGIVMAIFLAYVVYDFIRSNFFPSEFDDED